MYKLEIINPIVLQKLKEAYPTPPNSAVKALDKYLEVVSNLINDAIERGIEPYDKKFKLFSIPSTALSKNGCEIGSPKKGTRKRVHTALLKLGVPIIKTIVVGSGIQKTWAKVSINKNLARLVDIQVALDPKQTFDLRHPNFDKLTPSQLESDYDNLIVDIDGIGDYINKHFPNGAPTDLEERKKYTQANKILAAATYKDGLFYQKKRPSFFGRTYYEGSSVQNVNKELRTAMLGKCWEYDITSSVQAWKLGFAEAYIKRKKLTGNVEDYFPKCLHYLTDKNAFFNEIKLEMFRFSAITDKEQIKRIKAAFTALNFGATLTDSTYLDESRVPVERALAIQIDDEDACRIFVNNPLVIAFRDEMKLLDDQIEWEAKKNKCELFAAKHPKTGKKLSKKCRMSYRYQHAETEVMCIFRDIAKQYNLTILANIHDAIILRDKLETGLKDEIQQAMRSETGNDYWSLGEKQVEKFSV